MEVTSITNVEYNVNASFSEVEMNKLLDELEAVFARSVKEGTVDQIQALTEFKNLLTLSINNK